MGTLLERKRLSSYGRSKSASPVAEAPEKSGHGNDGSLEFFPIGLHHSRDARIKPAHHDHPADQIDWAPL
jgi:hypothetical protein